MPNKFDFYEIVKIVAKEKRYNQINNKIAVILGLAEQEDKTWSYAISVFDVEDGWSIPEDQLISTGKFAPPDYNKTGESITVVVNEKGEGMLKEDYLREKESKEKSSK